MAKRTASQVWAAVQEAAMDDEMEEVLSMTREQRHRLLLEAGFEIEKVHAQADALVAEPPGTRSIAAARSKRSRLAIALSIAATLAAGVVAVMEFASPMVQGVEAAAPQGDRAVVLRQEARAAWAAHDGRACLGKLDAARTLDPQGDVTPEVQALRRAVEDSTSHAP